MRTLIQKQQAPGGGGHPHGAQRYASKQNFTRPGTVGQHAERGLSSLLARLPEAQRAELRAWAESLAVPSKRGQR